MEWLEAQLYNYCLKCIASLNTHKTLKEGHSVVKEMYLLAKHKSALSGNTFDKRKSHNTTSMPIQSEIEETNYRKYNISQMSIFYVQKKISKDCFMLKSRIPNKRT